LASGKFFATEHAVVCTPVKKISAGWLACYLSRMNLNRFSESSAQPGLSVQKISHQQIALPKMEEQIAIESRLDAADESLNAEEIEIVKIKQLKTGLMTDLLTGRVRVPLNTKGTS
jgi:type I restriction enzyme S subunit